MRQPFFVVIALSVTHCGPSPADSTIDVTFDPCTAQPDSSSATENERTAMRRGLKMWRDALDAPSTDALETPQLLIEFETAAPVFYGVYDDERGIIFINREQKPESLSITIAHELGHAFGLEHVPVSERHSVMNPNNLVTRPTLEDVAALRALWGTCPTLD